VSAITDTRIISDVMFDRLKTAGWPGTTAKPTFTDIHTDVIQRFRQKPYYWYDPKRRLWSVCTDVRLLQQQIDACLADSNAGDGYAWYESPQEAAAGCWLAEKVRK
jgi:hypothetical protein